MKRNLTIGLIVLALGWQGTQALGQEANPVSALALLLKDKQTEVRRAAAFSLKYYPQSEPALPQLVEAFKDSDEVVRNNAVDAIVLMVPRSTVPTLLLALRDKDPLMRAHAAMALGRIRLFAEDAVPELVRLLKDENDNVRYAATEALKTIQGSATVH